MPQVRCPVVLGRDAERAHLRAALAEACAGSGSLVVVSGPAGGGKSRLVGDLLDHADASQLPAAVGRATPTGTVAAFRPLTQALHQLVRRRGLPPLDGDFAPWRAPLASVLPLVAGPAPVDCPVAVRGEAVLQLLARLADGTGALVVLEDLHWADPDTLAVVEYAADAVRSLPVLWVATCRDDPAPAGLIDGLRGRRGVTLVQLSRLSPTAVAEMVTACRPDASPDLVARVQRTADGLPLFVEEIVAAGGLPGSFARAVREQLATLDEVAARAVEAAAVLGTVEAWDLLPPVLRLPAQEVAAALERAESSSLLVRDGDGVRFRHALTREAVLSVVPGARRAQLAAAALTALSGGPQVSRGRPPLLVADLAEQAGDRRRAALVTASAGRLALGEGAIATAVESLQRALALLDGGADAIDVRLELVEALTLAGRVDDAMAEGARLLAEVPEIAHTPHEARARLLLAEAAAQAGRWATADGQLRALGPPAAPDADASAARRWMLAAEIAFATGRGDDAQDLVSRVLADPAAPPDVRCRGHALAGRMARLSDLGAARDAFDRGLAVARAARLPVRVLDALHELGTIELFDHAGTDRLLEARALAEKLGALGTRAVLDLQLTAAYLSRFDTEAAERHAEAARDLGGRLGLGMVVTKALCGLAEVRVQRRERADMERLLALATAAGPDDAFTPAFSWGQCRGLLALFEGDWAAALDHVGRGMELLRRVPHPEPVEFRALWPLLLARAADPRAEAALAEASSTGLMIAFANRGFLGYAAAILAGRSGDRARADDLALGADAYLVRFPGWLSIARLCAADAAAADGWGQPELWLADAAPCLAALGFAALAERCRPAAPSRRPGLTPREAEVLTLVGQGLANKEIGGRLHLSPRTVEKHVESLLRKTSTRSRTQLAVWATQGKTT